MATFADTEDPPGNRTMRTRVESILDQITVTPDALCMVCHGRHVPHPSDDHTVLSRSCRLFFRDDCGFINTDVMDTSIVQPQGLETSLTVTKSEDMNLQGSNRTPRASGCPSWNWKFHTPPSVGYVHDRGYTAKGSRRPEGIPRAKARGGPCSGGEAGRVYGGATMYAVNRSRSRSSYGTQQETLISKTLWRRKNTNI